MNSSLTSIDQLTFFIPHYLITGREALEAGYYHSPGWGTDYPKIQILTIEEQLHGAEIKMPPQHAVKVAEFPIREILPGDMGLTNINHVAFSASLIFDQIRCYIPNGMSTGG